MACKYNDSASHRLGFRSDEIERTRLNDIQHALEILSKVEESCMDFDTRTSEVYAALEYLSSIASRQSSLIAFRKALDWQHPEQRLQKVKIALRTIRSVIL